jgi:hypothetical protein
MSNFTHEWGFVVVRTAYAADETTDSEQWATALAKLRAYALPRRRNEEMHPDTLGLPVMADRTLLDGVSYDAVRTAFNSWITAIDRDDWESDVRRDCCLVIDGPALTSLLEAPDPASPRMRGSEPWVVVVDAADLATLPYNGGGPYLGWMRALAGSLNELCGDLDSRSMHELCPIRKYDGQIPLYDDGVYNTLVDPEGGVSGRYKFPYGTPRGIEGGRAMLADIERALGSRPRTGIDAV